MRKLIEAIRYYEEAVELDPALEEGRLVPVMERLKKSCEFSDRGKELAGVEIVLVVLVHYDLALR